MEELEPDARPRPQPALPGPLRLPERPRGGSRPAPVSSSTPLPATSGAAKLDLALSLAERAGGGLAGIAEYSADLFDAGTVARLLGYLRMLLAGAAAEPGRRLADLPLLAPAELDQILRGWNQTAVARPEGLLLHELFEAQAARTPPATALLWGEERLTYGDLDARASAQARRLVALGVGPEVRVGLFAGRSPALVVGALAVLQGGRRLRAARPGVPARAAGGDPRRCRGARAPRERRFAGLLAGSAAHLVALDEEGEPEGGGAVRAPRGGTRAERARRLAYVIYTSGSTGRPKGVAIEHRSAVELAFWARDRFTPAEPPGLSPPRRSASTSRSSSSSRPSPGAARRSWPPRRPRPPRAAGSRRGITLVNYRPLGHGGAAADERGAPSVRTVCLAGEALRGSLARRIGELPAVARLFNLYGPSEDTTYSTWAEVERGAAGEPAIGRPVANSRAYVLDTHLRPVPAGVTGSSAWPAPASPAAISAGRT